MDYRLSNLIDIDKTRELLESFSRAVGVPAAIIDLEGAVLVTSPWKRVCTDFHRQNKTTCNRCIESDTILANDLLEGKTFSFYRCLNGLTDAASPIVIEGNHLANAFIGQFLTEEPDLEFFRRQAREFGFDEPSYLEAVSKVPVISKESLPSILSFLTTFAEMTAGLGLRQLRQLETEKELYRSREQFRVTLESIGDGVIATDAGGLVTFINPVAAEVTGWKNDEAKGLPVEEVFRAINEKTRNPAEDVVRRVLQDGRTVALTNHTSLISRDGREIPIEDSAAPIVDATGQTSGVVLVFHNVAEQRRSQEKIETVARFPDENPNPVLRVSSDGKLLYANRSSMVLSGALGFAAGETLPEEWRRHALETLHCGSSREMEVECAEVVYSLILVPVSDLGYLNIYGQDITERKRVEKALRESEAQFRLLSQTASSLLASEDPQSIVEELCRDVMSHLDCQAFFNFLVDESIGKLRLNAYAGIPKDEAAKIEWLDFGVAVCGCAAREGARIVAEDIFNTPDIRTDLVRSYGIQAYACHPLKIGGKVIGTLSFGTKTRTKFSPQELALMKTVADQVAVAMERIRLIEGLRRSHAELELRVQERTAELESVNRKLVVEIEERKRANETVIAERQRFFGVLETLPVYVCLLMPDYHVGFANRVFRERFGESPGKRCFEHLFGIDKPCEDCKTYKVLETMAPIQWEWTGPDNRDYSVFDFPFTDTDGSTLILEMGIDITERNKAQARLTAAISRLELINQELQEFAFIASHDLQEPLRKIQTFGDMLRTRCGGDLGEQGKDYLLRMEGAAARMRQLIHDLLQFSRAATRPQPYKAVDLRDVLARVFEIFEPNFKEVGASIEISDLPVIDADEVQMKQLFQNLIDNALKYRKETGPLAVRIYSEKPDGENCRIMVQDNGIGFEEQFVDKIFAPFQRLHTGDREGTGMGLAICRKIVERHGGSITARSRPGVGSTFIIHLPVQQVGE